MKSPLSCRRVLLVLAMLFIAGTGPAHAAVSAWAGDQRGQVRLVTGSDYTSGGALRAGLEFRYPDGWHGYWRTPGDAGIAPVLDWSKSGNLGSVSVAWPAPARLVVAGLQNGVYTGHFILPLTLQLEQADVATHLVLSLDYASCSTVCIPEHANLSVVLPIGPRKASGEAGEIAAALARVPGAPRAAGIDVVKSEVEGAGAQRHLTVQLRSDGIPFHAPDLFVEGAGAGLPPAPTISFANQKHSALLTVALPAAQTSKEQRALTITVVDGARTAEFRGPVIGESRSGPVHHDIAFILVLALLGGAILNLMPCVLPVLSLKMFSLVRDVDAGRQMVRRGAAASALGIVTSFMVLAVSLSGLKLAGATLGWGIQFQRPWFLASMAAMTTVFSASFFGWFSIALPRILSGAFDAPARGPLAEAFLGGVLATLLATPCSAPFVGTAVGFALARSPAEILAVFFCLGIGMALPFIFLALAPSMSGLLPRPGQWMVKLRVALGILLLCTAAWLIESLATVAGVRVAATTGALLVLLLGLLAAAARVGKVAKRGWMQLATLTLALGSVVFASVAGGEGTTDLQDPGGWQTFKPATIAARVAEGQTVIVDVSASWCLTCKVNQLTAFNTARVRRRLMQPGTIRMRADWSHTDPLIAAYIQRFGRFGIPLDVVYGPGRPEGELLPEILDSATVIRALDDATGTPATANADAS